MGKNILKKGGNAVDAGITTGICVGIVNSFSSGIGGGGFALIKEDKDVSFYNFREQAPEDIDNEEFNTNELASKVGAASIAVPSEIKGYYEMHKQHGKLNWSELFDENIKLARDGFEVSYELEKRLKKMEKYILPNNFYKENNKDLFLENGMTKTFTKMKEGTRKLLKSGDILKRKNLANTLEILSNRPLDLYEGELAAKLIKSLSKIGSKLTLKDLKNYRVVKSKPLTSRFKEYDVFTSGLPSSGIFLILGLNILENFDLEYIQKTHSSSIIYHLLNEIFKFMSTHRGEFTDPNFMSDMSTVNLLLSKEYAKKVSEKINLDRILPQKEYNQDTSFNDTSGTTHINVVDENGMVFCLTSSINLEFGSKYMEEETGIILNNTVDDFWIQGQKNAYELPKSSKNIIESKKRPFSSMAPIILDSDKRTLIFGGAGGSRIPTSILSSLVHIFNNKTLKQSIELPRIHHQLQPSVTFIENILSVETRNMLMKKGNELKESALNSGFTSIQGTIVNKGKYIESYSDNRKGGESKGY